MLDCRANKKLYFNLLCTFAIIIFTAFNVQWKHQTIETELPPVYRVPLVHDTPVEVVETLHEEKHNEDLAIEWLMRERRQVVRQMCATVKEESKTDEMPDFIPIDSLDALFLPIAKAGSTNWKKMIMLIEKEAPVNVTKPGQISGSEATEFSRSKMRQFVAQHKSNSSIAQMRQKFMVVREPFQRLLSAYRNKIEPPKRNDMFGKWSRQISAKYRVDQSDPIERAATFDEFLRYFVNPKEKTNGHWIGQNKLAQSCRFQYDYILKLEDIEFESNWLFRHLKLDLTYPPVYGHDHDKNELTEKYLKNIDKNLLRQVHDQLRFDYQLFNYPLPSFFYIQ